MTAAANPHRLAMILRRRANLLDRVAWAIENKPVAEAGQNIAIMRQVAQAMRRDADKIKPKRSKRHV